jgi:type II secretory pathway pseudopilin PulG
MQTSNCGNPNTVWTRSGAARSDRRAIRNPPSAIRNQTPLATRRGVTLLELLAVIIIIVTVTAATIPALLPALANRRVREASRMVNVFFAGARNRALQTGRPVGVMLERFNGLPDAAMTLSYCEVPPPYSGDVINSTIHISQGKVTKFDMGDQGWQGVVRQGDLLKLNYQGNLYRLTGTTDAQGFLQSPSSNNWQLVHVTAPPGSPLPGTPNDLVVPFQIFRAPVKLASGSIQLPEGTVVDLYFSGFDWPAAAGDPVRTSGTWTFQPNPALGSDPYPVAITFNPNGSVHKVWCYNNDLFANNPGWGPQDPITPIHLLIGRRELLPPTTSPKNDPNKADYNWQDPSNLWVSINGQTGLVATTENAVPNNPGDPVYQQLLDVRRFARESHTMGGR